MTTNTISTAQLLSPNQAAELLGLSVRTIRRRIASGQLPAYRSGRKVIRIKTSDLDSIFRRIPSAKA